MASETKEVDVDIKNNSSLLEKYTTKDLSEEQKGREDAEGEELDL